jgi:hypothetical protein
MTTTKPPGKKPPKKPTYLQEVETDFYGDVDSCSDWVSGGAVLAALSAYRMLQGRGFALSCAIAGLATVFADTIAQITLLPVLLSDVGLKMSPRLLVTLLSGGLALGFEATGGRKLDLARIYRDHLMDFGIGVGLAYIGYYVGSMLSKQVICNSS